MIGSKIRTKSTDNKIWLWSDFRVKLKKRIRIRGSRSVKFLYGSGSEDPRSEKNISGSGSKIRSEILSSDPSDLLGSFVFLIRGSYDPMVTAFIIVSARRRPVGLNKFNILFSLLWEKENNRKGPLQCNKRCLTWKFETISNEGWFGKSAITISKNGQKGSFW